LRVVLLGSAAGGGVPQWNCGCRNCVAARAAGVNRTQSSVAVSADGERWVLLNASPDLRQQVASCRVLWPRGLRESPIAAVVLTDAEIDHTLGLMLLREASARLPVYATAGVSALLHDHWPLFRVLEAYAGVDARSLSDGDRVTLRDGTGRDLGLQCTALSVARPPPRYARDAPMGSCDVGLRLEDRRGGGTFAYIPTAGAVDEAVRALAAGVDLLCFDGTFWSDDELHAAGIDAPRASGMGHLPVGGPDGSLAALPSLGAKRSVLIHINNTNPIIDPASSERARVLAAGLEVGEDGMEFEI
jgi:pyrroloquinoline quinone biosynthesis protein B